MKSLKCRKLRKKQKLLIKNSVIVLLHIINNGISNILTDEIVSIVVII